MIKRVAAAIDAIVGPDLKSAFMGAGAGESGALEYRRRMVLECARAALKAIRKPTIKMVNDGWQKGNHGWGEGEEIPSIWKAMIDSALEEEGK